MLEAFYHARHKRWDGADDDDDDETPLQYWLRSGPTVKDVEANRRFGQPASERLRTHAEIWAEFCREKRMECKREEHRQREMKAAMRRMAKQAQKQRTSSQRK
ncbi:hypothetical protein EVG20_g2146 [Dentipellis fragilis]|uniref:Uncharacterized protein n=1 Tax=Dentipellis fragilis TaxID=205917 RepID=A0A4Y9Z8T2_9AGAM|nr:hypothetical protein EVG20_g2146 [Dentipellis fragilis]